MGAAYLSAAAGIESDTLENSAAYLKGWLDILKAKDNRKWIIQAASAAQKATDCILSQADLNTLNEGSATGQNSTLNPLIIGEIQPEISPKNIEYCSNIQYIIGGT